MRARQEAQHRLVESLLLVSNFSHVATYDNEGESKSDFVLPMTINKGHLIMMKRSMLLALFCLALVPTAVFAQVFTTSLSGANEPDGGDPDGTGIAVVAINGTTVNYLITAQNLSTITAAHIHRVSTSKVEIPLNPVFNNGVAIGSVSNAAQSLIDEIVANPSAFYVNIHSSEKPGGAIRGSLAGGAGISGQDVASACVDSDSALCLDGGRFRVETSWRTSDGKTGSGHAVRLTGDTAYFWFFSSNNVEMTVKVLNACSISTSHWVFASGLTNVQVVLKVTDTSTGKTRTYTNPNGTPFVPVQDTSAFACP